MSKTLLETINLKKSYDHTNGNITIFNNLNLKIKHGDLIALVGPSGSGKSSLLHLFALLDEPSKGKILINNTDTKNLNNIQKDEMRRKNISIIFQDNNLLTDFTALENVMMPLLIKGEHKKNILSKAKKILKDVKILNRSNHFPSELSGGEQQRVAIARALIKDPLILLADEPTGSLDSTNTSLVFDLMINLANKKNTITIMATHNINLIGKLTKSYKIDGGKLFDSKR